MDVTITPRQGLKGLFSVPGDKSISHRALFIGALAEGTSVIKGLSRGDDPLSTMRCLRALGVEILDQRDQVTIVGRGLKGLRPARNELDAGNSGTTIRLLTGILSGQRFDSTISGDASLRRRPMKRIIDPLTMMGAKIKATENLTPPVAITGVPKLSSITYELPVASAQVKSALLFAGLFADGTTTVVESIRTRDHTERMLGLKVVAGGSKTVIEVEGGTKIEPRDFRVPGDFSSAAFLLVAGLLVPGSDLTIRNVGLNPTRTKLLDILCNHGANVAILNREVIGGEPVGDIRVRSSELHGDLTLGGNDVAALIDEIPSLVVAWMFSNFNLTLRDARELRVKESDRIKALVVNLRAVGLDVTEFDDGFAFRGNNDVLGGVIDSFDDHRIAMAFGVAGLRTKEGIRVQRADCVSISYPRFWDVLQAM